MGRKIFVSYKYHDTDVQNLSTSVWVTSNVRDYVDKFEQLLDQTDHIYKGEPDNEDMSALSENTIWQKLRDRIFDSTLTVVFISPKMKEEGKIERDQWIPWEVSYSLKETSRRDSSGNLVTSKTNAMLAVVLPDRNGAYSYYLENRTCCQSNCVMHYRDRLFKIISLNKFNIINGSKRDCSVGGEVWTGTCSYIEAVKWCDFTKNINSYITQAYDRQADIENYLISKEVQ